MGKKKTLRDHASGLTDTLAPHVESAREKAGPVLADARDKAGPVLADARDKGGAYLADARDKAAPYLADARDKAAPYLADARDKAAPVLSEARDKAAPYVSDAKDKFTSDVLPVVTAALAAVDEATEDARAETKKRGKAVAAALKGEVEAPEKKHRVRSLLIVLGLGGIAFAVAKRLGRRQPTTSWQSSYTPPPAPVPPAAGGPVAGAGTGAHRADAEPDDTAASDPGEAASDATDVPHDASTPDNPVTEIDVDKK
jgi:vacuolar-type H+-ATPase subunit H